MPAGLLVQFISLDAEGGEAGYRIYADGRYETHPVGKAWSWGEPLDEGQLAGVRAAVAEAEFAALPTVNERPGVRHDGRMLWVQAVDGAGAHSIVLVGPARLPAIDQLSARLMAVFTES
jgi:hypothetical protein